MSKPTPSSTADPGRNGQQEPSTEDAASRRAMLDAWLGVPLAGRTSPVSSATVTVHTEPAAAFASFEAAVAACSGPDSLVLIAGWSFRRRTRLSQDTTVGAALTAAAARGVPVRALFTRFPVVRIGRLPGIRVTAGRNRAATAFVKGLPGGAAIHDGWLLHRNLTVAGARLVNPVQTGVHHQKIWTVRNGPELRAWCGGMDFHPSRTEHPGPAMHDVQAELTGPGAVELYAIVRERWNAHPRRPPHITIPAVPAGSPTGPHLTRILTTYADPCAYAGLGGPRYPFAPSGSTALRDFLFHSIDRAQRSIYLEDQYLVDEEIASHLATALPRIEALIMVISGSDEVNAELHQAWDRRRRFLAHLAPHAAKVATVVSRRYVHAKVWLFDDEVALVSSANVNRRSMTHDSEVGVAFGDLSGPGEVRRLRERLWAQHLGEGAPPVSEAPERSLALWQSPPEGSPVHTYDATAGTDIAPVDPRVARLFTPDEFWDQVVDPTV